MIRLTIRPRVRGDMAEIWHYTAEQWGVKQADQYIRQIEQAFRRAINHPEAGSSVHGLARHYRKLRSGSHRIIYRVDQVELIVVRILHEREDVPDESEL